MACITVIAGPFGNARWSRPIAFKQPMPTPADTDRFHFFPLYISCSVLLSLAQLLSLTSCDDITYKNICALSKDIYRILFENIFRLSYRLSERSAPRAPSIAQVKCGVSPGSIQPYEKYFTTTPELLDSLVRPNFASSPRRSSK